MADFDSEREMLSAISKINGMDFDGNRIRVTEVQASAHNDYDDRGGYDYGSQGRGSGAGATIPSSLYSTRWLQQPVWQQALSSANGTRMLQQWSNSNDAPHRRIIA